MGRTISSNKKFITKNGKVILDDVLLRDCEGEILYEPIDLSIEIDSRYCSVITVNFVLNQIL